MRSSAPCVLKVYHWHCSLYQTPIAARLTPAVEWERHTYARCGTARGGCLLREKLCDLRSRDLGETASASVDN
jgi:hypothetical protein